MRVDFVSPRFHPTMGGIESAMEGLAEDLIRRGHSVTVHTTHFPELAFEESWRGIEVRRYKAFPQLGYYASRFRPKLPGDVVHLHGYAHATNDGVIRRFAGSRPVFLSTHHGINFPKRTPWGRLYHAAYNRFVGIRSLRRVSAVLVPTEVDADAFRRRGVPSDRIRLFPTGLPDAAFDRPAGSRPPWPLPRPYALYLGRLHREKGVLDLVEAYERQPLPFDLVLAGPDDGARSQLDVWKKNSAAGPHVHVRAPTGEDDKWEALDACEFLVLPSHYEGQGIVVAEAWARGRAVLATSAGALAKVVRSEVDGLLVPPRDVAALADALVRLGAEGGLRERLGRAGRVHAREAFRRSKLVDELITWYEEARGGAGGRPGSR